MVVGTLPRGSDTMSDIRKKRVRVSKQRQVNIPKEFYEALNLTDEAIMEFNGKEITIKPSESEVVGFSGDILADLIDQGYEGKELLAQFNKIKADIPNAIQRMANDKVNRRFTDMDDLDRYLDEEVEEDE